MVSNYICTLDIGSSKIAACAAKIKNKSVSNIFFESVPSRGIKDGVIVDSIEVIGSVSKCLKSLRSNSGININALYVNISGQDIITKHSRAIVPLAEKGNKIITASDIQKVNEQARILGSSLEEEIIHLLPSSYSIDSKTNIANPLGLYSHRLEGDLYLVCAKLSSVQSLSRVIHQAGFEIKELFFSGLASSKAALHKDFLEGVNIFCDIGSDITEILIFKNGLLNDIQVLDTGAQELTKELQERFKIPYELAEEIKKTHAVIGDYQQIGEERQILVKRSNLYKPIKQKEVSEAITQAARSFCNKIKAALESRLSCYEADNFIIVGRSVILEGFIETLESILSIPVRIGRISNPLIPPSIRESRDLAGSKYLTYITALGMLCEALEKRSQGFLNVKPTGNIFARTVSRFKEVYQEYF